MNLLICYTPNAFNFHVELVGNFQMKSCWSIFMRKALLDQYQQASPSLKKKRQKENVWQNSSVMQEESQRLKWLSRIEGHINEYAFSRYFRVS